VIATGRTRDGGTAARALDVAERLIQVRGFNAVSYADVSKELGVTTAALHYHFAEKADLGEALIHRYRERFNDALAAIDRSTSEAVAKLEAYAALYGDVLRNDRMCLCGMLAAEFDSLSGGMRDEVLLFFRENEAWLAEVLSEGRATGVVVFDGTPLEEGRSIVSCLEGAMLVARSFGEIDRFQHVADHLLATLRSPQGSLSSGR
jgi:TetR/AcrR family transcriptional regulator, transcriptional repressor for nem operon